MGNAFRVILLSVLLLFLSLVHGTRSLAASATMGFTPDAGSYGKPFSVSLVIDGQGEKFNAAEANVILPSGLAVKELILGDCNFSFLKTPSIKNPSFSGVILGAYSTKCTAYTLSLVPIAKGQATLTLAKAAVRRYGDAVNILSTASNASYALTAALKAPAVDSAQIAQNGLYTAAITVLSAGKAVPNATVNLTAVATKSTQIRTTDSAGKVQFANLQAGVYNVVVSKNKQTVGESIINISGTNPTLAFSIDLAAQEKNPLLKKQGSVLGIATTSPYVLASLGGLAIVFGISFGIALSKLKWKKKTSR